MGSKFYGGASSQSIDWPKARNYDASIDAKWLFLPITSPSSKGELFMGAAKIFDFISGHIQISNGVKLINAPNLAEPDPMVVISYDTKIVKWEKRMHNMSGEPVKGYDTIPNSDTDSVIKERKKHGNSGFYKKEVGGYFNEYKK